MPIVVIVIAAVLALIMGSQLAASDYRGLSLWVFIVVGVFYVVKLYEFSWQIILLLGFSGFSYFPLGFQIDAEHLSFLAAGTLAVMNISAGGRKQQDVLPGSRLLKFFLISWILYGVAHFLYNYVSPYRPSEYSLRNSLKSYFSALAPAIVLLYFMWRPSGIRFTRRSISSIGLIVAVSGLINVAFGIFLLRIGTVDEAANMWMTGIYIPVINAVPGIYIGRLLGPLSALVGWVLLTGDWRRERPFTRTLFSIFLMFQGVALSLLSSGRGVIIISLAYIFIVCVLRRKIVTLVGAAAFGIVLIATANIFSRQINQHAPMFVARSMQLLLFDKGSSALGSIESSTDWRAELRSRAFDEWKTDNRTFFFGRSVYVFNSADTRIRKTMGGYYAGMESALRRGATHNLTTDLLLQYGIIGLILYVGFFLALIRALWKAYSRSRMMADSNGLNNLMVILISYFAVAFPMSFIAGSFLPMWLMWLMLLAYAALAEQLSMESTKVEEAPTLDSRQLTAAKL